MIEVIDEAFSEMRPPKQIATSLGFHSHALSVSMWVILPHAIGVNSVIGLTLVSQFASCSAQSPDVHNVGLRDLPAHSVGRHRWAAPGHQAGKHGGCHR